MTAHLPAVAAAVAIFLAQPLTAQRAASGTLIASNMEAGTVSIVDIASGTTIATTAVGEGPHEVAVSPDGRQAVVAIYGNRTSVGSSLAVFDLNTPTAPPRIVELGPGNQRPHGLAYLPDGRSLLVTGERAQRVLVVDLTTSAIDSSMSTKQAATHMVAISKDGKRAFTTNISAMSVSAIDVPSRTVTGTYPIGARIEGIGVTPDGREVWVGGNESHQVYVIDGATGEIKARIDGFGFPYRVGITSDNRTAVVSDAGSEKIHLLDVATRTIRSSLDIPALLPAEGPNPSPQGVTLSRDGAFAFVTLKAVAKVVVVDVRAGTIVKTLPVGAGSDGVGYSPLMQVRAQSPLGRVIDLGHALASTDPTWSGKPTFERTGSPRMGRIATDEHFGTHFDAPSHGGAALTVDQFPVERLVRPAICIAITGKPDDYQISAADVHAWEAQHGAVAEGSIVLFATGWDSRWPDRARYMNERNGIKHFPGIAPDAARYLRDRKIAGMGIDTPSVDYGPSTTFETHGITNPAGIFHIESAANLTQLPATGFTVVVAPIKIAGGSGGPTRVFALVP
jgi:kynurenine formamidase/DNA-binding beta-propeller fold protein YncE